MTGLGGLIGFGVVFSLIGVATSVVACAALAGFTAAARRRGPAVERRAVELATLVPIVAATIGVAALVAHSLTASDHCPGHGHHAHLCVAHGAAWLERPWAIAAGAAALMVGLGRATVLASIVLRGRARVRALASVATVVGELRLVESPRAFCFVAGLWRSAIYASTAAWRGLDDDERAAMLAHERAHVRGRDVARRALLDLAMIVAAPLAPAYLAARWDDATERLRDADAAAISSPDAVARALLAMCRLGAVRVAGASFEAGARTLSTRIAAVLAEVPSGRSQARTMVAAATTTILMLAVASAIFASSLHHALETLLG